MGAQSTTTDICDRTWWVRNKILELTPSDDTCTSVSASELAAITEMDFNGNGTAHLKAGDFDGLTGLEELDLSNMGIARIQYSSGANAPCKNNISTFVEDFHRLGRSISTTNPSTTSYTDDVGGSDLVTNGRTVRSLKYHVFAVLPGPLYSLPTTITIEGGL